MSDLRHVPRHVRPSPPASRGALPHPVRASRLALLPALLLLPTLLLLPVGPALSAAQEGVAPTAPKAGPGDPSGPAELLPDLFSDDDLQVEINISSVMLRMLAEAARNSDDPSFAEVLAGLDDIQVRVAELRDELEPTARRQLREATRTLERRGWQAMVRVRDEEDETYIYLLQSGERITGLVVLFADDTEAGLVHIRGDIDPRQLGRVAAALDLGTLEDALEEGLQDRLSGSEN